MDDYTHYDFWTCPGASTARIEAAYQTIKQRLNGHSDEQMIRMIHEAYTVLSTSNSGNSTTRSCNALLLRQTRTQACARQPGHTTGKTRPGCSHDAAYRGKRVGCMSSLRHGFDAAPRLRCLSSQSLSRAFARGCGPVPRCWCAIDASFIPGAWRSTVIVHWSSASTASPPPTYM
jgi:hypothetical protein